MVVEVKTLPSYHVAYIRRLGYSKGEFQEHLSAAFQQVCRWAADRDLFRSDTLVIGVPHDNPDISPTARCRYDACVTVPGEVTQGSANVDIQDLHGGKYAVQRIDVDGPGRDRATRRRHVWRVAARKRLSGRRPAALRDLLR